MNNWVLPTGRDQSLRNRQIYQYLFGQKQGTDHNKNKAVAEQQYSGQGETRYGCQERKIENWHIGQFWQLQKDMGDEQKTNEWREPD